MGQYATACAAAMARIDEAAASATRKDYYRAQSFRELALIYAKEADEQVRQRQIAIRHTSDIGHALDVLENTVADDILDVEFAMFVEHLLGKLHARSKAPALSHVAFEIGNLCELLQKSAGLKRTELRAVA